MGDPFTEHDVKFSFAERRRYFVFHYFHFGQFTKNLFTIFDGLAATDIQTYRSCLLYTSLQEELNGVAFQSPYGEYSFASVPSEGMVSREDLFLDLLSIVSDSADVKRMIVISFNEEYGKKVTDALHEVKGKEVIQFRMNEPELPVDYKWDMLAFPVMQALGIKAEELQ